MVTINILTGIKKCSKKTAILPAIAAFGHNNVNESIKYVLTNSVKIVKSAIKNFGVFQNRLNLVDSLTEAKLSQMLFK